MMESAFVIEKLLIASEPNSLVALSGLILEYIQHIHSRSTLL